MKLVTVAEMQDIEREAEAAGLTYAQMMENAGLDLAKQIIQAYGYSPDKSALGLVGSGNNGGDTLVALAYLAGRGWRTTAYAVRQRPADDLLVARFTDTGGRYVRGDEDRDYRQTAEDHEVGCPRIAFKRRWKKTPDNEGDQGDPEEGSPPSVMEISG